MIRLKMFNFNLQSVYSDQLKTVIMFYFNFKTYWIIEASELININIILISKNLCFMIFLTFVNANDVKKLQIIIKKCEDILSILNHKIKIFKLQRKIIWD